MGKPNMNAKKGEFLKQCSGCFIKKTDRKLVAV